MELDERPTMPLALESQQIQKIASQVKQSVRLAEIEAAFEANKLNAAAENRANEKIVRMMMHQAARKDK
jgi:hypothetical protein